MAYPNGFSYRKKITIDYTKVSSDQTNFPTLISHTDIDLAKALVSGWDIRFTSNDGTTKLSHEIESFTQATGILEAWVKIPILSSNADTNIYIYYGKPSVTATEEDPTNVWNSNYDALYRFKSGALTTDTSAGAHTLTAIGVPIDGTPKFGGSIFLGNSSAYSAVDGADFQPTGAFTVGAWIRAAAGNIYYFQSMSQNTNMAGFRIRLSSGGVVGFLSGKNTGIVSGTDYREAAGATDLRDNLWHFVVCTSDGVNGLRIYVDGKLDGYSASWVNAPAYAATNYVRVGCNNSTGTNAGFWSGSLDDVFLLNGYALSTEDVATIYASQTSPSTFYSLEVEETYITTSALGVTGNWKAYLYNKANVFQAELPFDSISITKELNKIGVAKLGVSYFILDEWVERQGFTTDSLLTSGFKWVSILRNDVVMFKGILSEIGMDGSGEDISLTLTFKNWLAYFQKRFISKTYSNTHAGTIAWDMLDTSQLVANGDIGVTQGSVVDTTHRDRTFVNDEVALGITKLSSTEIDSGFEFEISDEKVFTVASRLGSDKPEIVFDDLNTKSWLITYVTGLSLTNSVLALGNGISETRNSVGTQQTDWYLLQEKASYTSVIEPATLQAHGDSVLDKKQDVTRSPEITVININVDISDYSVGDGVTVRLGGIIDALYRIKSKTINVNSNEETVNLDFI